jgi:hypothetical protein
MYAALQPPLAGVWGVILHQPAILLPFHRLLGAGLWVGT